MESPSPVPFSPIEEAETNGFVLPGLDQLRVVSNVAWYPGDLRRGERMWAFEHLCPRKPQTGGTGNGNAVVPDENKIRGLDLFNLAVELGKPDCKGYWGLSAHDLQTPRHIGLDMCTVMNFRTLTLSLDHRTRAVSLKFYTTDLADILQRVKRSQYLRPAGPDGPYLEPCQGEMTFCGTLTGALGQAAAMHRPSKIRWRITRTPQLALDQQVIGARELAWSAWSAYRALSAWSAGWLSRSAEVASSSSSPSLPGAQMERVNSTATEESSESSGARLISWCAGDEARTHLWTCQVLDGLIPP